MISKHYKTPHKTLLTQNTDRQFRSCHILHLPTITTTHHGQMNTDRQTLTGRQGQTILDLYKKWSNPSMRYQIL